ncbi:YeeE/YedE family protein [Dissulfurirhabdus thermomarina]|uniref:YeeE/YedE family protein n=1 Tax=Dissulfurirhabdus thermomarina TaxID=1765737 RepID=A0A6N9TJX5_DISTH|nr:YeeE/YedE thiosulfate transporter family protein [Dissulfurirhabdus thermomarina]NDY41378.1 YeeE/YedE family protein [Dissulfurirhabdus thermomarina]NMX23606.1 YeeE/YedE family protein [Dissulfurirhabdus thermomarina]
MSTISDKVKEVYEGFFKKTWSPMTGGILLAVLAIYMFAWHRPWGIVGGLRNWGDWVLYSLGLLDLDEAPAHPLFYSSSVMDLGLLAGAWISAVIAKEFAIRIPPMLEIWKGLVAGILMGIGSALAFGCNVGGFYSALQNLAANGLTMMVGLIIGVIIGLKYLYWEMEHLTPGPAGPTWLDKKIPAVVGFIALAALIWAAYAYGGSDMEDADLMPGYLLIGAGIGYVFHRSRLCMVNGFREPFMTGEAAMGKAVAVSVIIGTLGIAIMKYMDLRPEGMYVVPAFWWGSLVGGIVFGAAMVVAGGCGSGSLWRVAEGQVKLWVVVIAFALSNSAVRYWFDQNDWLYTNDEYTVGMLGKAIYLPDYLGYGGSILLVIAAMLVWYIVIDWNEDSNKLVIEM